MEPSHPTETKRSYGVCLPLLLDRAIITVGLGFKDLLLRLPLHVCSSSYSYLCQTIVPNYNVHLHI
jgi:hypothetical protein